MVLSVLAQSREPQSVAELQDRTGLPRSTLYRQLGNLRRWGFVSERDGQYLPGEVSLELAHGFDSHSRLIQTARPMMTDLAAQSGESVAIVAAVSGRAICIEMVDSRQSLRCSFDKGRSVPLLDGASAKCLLAHMPRADATAALARAGLDARDRRNRIAALDAIRLRGHAVSEGEVDVGVWGASAPIRDAQGRLEAVLTVMAPTSRVTDLEAALVHMVLVTAARISRALAERRLAVAPG